MGKWGVLGVTLVMLAEASLGCEVILGNNESYVLAPSGTGTTSTSSSSGSGVIGASCKALKPEADSGVYWINPADSDSFQAYCDMTTPPGGWTRVLVAQSGQCAFPSDGGAFGDPVDASSVCAKYSDDTINALSTAVMNDAGKVFYTHTDIGDASPEFTLYTGTITTFASFDPTAPACQMPPPIPIGAITNAKSYALLEAATLGVMKNSYASLFQQIDYGCNDSCTSPSSHLGFCPHGDDAGCFFDGNNSTPTATAAAVCATTPLSDQRVDAGAQIYAYVR
jgi:Fibrinogen beta and gamma chains, C-terminal globular domain